MKVVLTGSQEVGKTTLLKDVRGASRGAFWVIAERTFGLSHEKTGFRAVTSTGLMGQFDNRTPKGHHNIDIEAVDRLFTAPIEEALKDQTHLVIIDEVGAFERESSAFTHCIDQVFKSRSCVLASSTEDAEWTRHYSSLPMSFLLTLTAENRDQVSQILTAFVASSRMLFNLPMSNNLALAELAKTYASQSGYDELLKLFKNTVGYLSDHKYQMVSEGLYSVTGLTRRHQVERTTKGWVCDCDLYEGRGQFTGHPGECSHIQTVKVGFGLD